MSSIDEEIRIGDEEDSRELAYIRSRLPSELKEKFTDDELLLMTEAIAEYFFSSGVLEGNDEEIELDLEAISKHVCEEALLCQAGPFDPEEVFFVVQADLDFQELED